jgi:hypothetical protein
LAEVTSGRASVFTWKSVNLFQQATGKSNFHESITKHPLLNQPMRTLLSTLLALGIVSTASGALPFMDNFGNGMPANNDSITGFWTLIPPPPFTTSQILEDVGVPGVTPTNLHLIAASQADLVETTASSDFNFFNHPLNITLSGLSFAVTGIGGTTAGQEQFRFSLMSSGGQTPFAANSAVTLFIDAAGDVKFGYKLSGNGNAEDATQLLNTNVAANGGVTGFSLTLSNTAYNLTLTETGGSSNFSGAIAGLTASSWIPGGNGDSALALEGLRNNATSDSVMVNVDQLVVVPEPATNVLLICGLLTVGGLAIFLGKKLG